MNNKKIAVVDVETPNHKHNSICSIGITIIEQDKIIDEIYHLINPEDAFDINNINIHGITEADVVNKDIFPSIWDKVSFYFNNYLLVFHNKSFDLSCIKKSLIRYNIEASPIHCVDTLEIARKYLNTKDNSLPTLCEYYGINLETHHNALSDCRATGKLLMKMKEDLNINFENFIKEYDFTNCENRKKSNTFFIDCKNTKGNSKTKELQELQGIIMGVSIDGILNDIEIRSVKKWMDKHSNLKGNFPFDKIYETLEKVLEDNVITELERKETLELFNNMINPVDINNSIKTEKIDITNLGICVTGDFENYTKRDDFTAILESFGAVIKKSVVKSLSYLVVGELGSELWSQGAYGGKIKRAMEFNEKGSNIEIIKENDFLKLIGLK